MHLGLPVITSNKGGAKELFKDKDYPGIIDMNPAKLRDAISDFIENCPPPPVLMTESSEIVNQWVDFHNQIINNTSSDVFYKLLESNDDLPLISVVITHYERIEKLLESVSSIMLQTYPRIELIVVDDGSKSDETKLFLHHSMEPLLKLFNGQLVFQDNAYLGAARNTGMNVALGEYICFLDDDDIALPNMIQDLFISMITTQSEVVVALNSYMPLANRSEMLKKLSDNYIASYLPTGGPYSLSALENCIGGATSLFKIKTIKDLGGYSEVYGVGHEDYELYVKLLAKEKKILVCPRVLYLYEVGRPSMLSNTSISENYMRNFSAFDANSNALDIINLQIGQKLDSERNGRIQWLMSSRNYNLCMNVLNVWPNRELSIKNYMELLSSEGRSDSFLFKALEKDLNNF
jgi:glycosyltransferase involved in cell wall biosynthesis